MSLDGSSLVPQPPVEPLVEPSVVEVVVVSTRVECPSVAVVVAPSGPAVPVSTDVTLFLRVLSGAEPLATLQVVAHVELPSRVRSVTVGLSSISCFLSVRRNGISTSCQGC